MIHFEVHSNVTEHCRLSYALVKDQSRQYMRYIAHPDLGTIRLSYKFNCLSYYSGQRYWNLKAPSKYQFRDRD